MAIQANLRVSEDLHSRLVDAADQRGVSMNKEINDRLERTFREDSLGGTSKDENTLRGILSMLGAAMTSAGQAAGFFSTYTMEGARKWLDSPFAFEQAAQAASTILEKCRPQGDKRIPSGVADHASTFGIGFAHTIIEEAATGNSRSADMKDRATMLRGEVGHELAARLKAHLPLDPLMLQATAPPTSAQPVLGVFVLTDAEPKPAKRRPKK